MSKVSCLSSGKALEAPLRMARAELLHFYCIQPAFIYVWVLHFLPKYLILSQRPFDFEGVSARGALLCGEHIYKGVNYFGPK